MTISRGILEPHPCQHPFVQEQPQWLVMTTLCSLQIPTARSNNPKKTRNFFTEQGVKVNPGSRGKSRERTHTGGVIRQHSWDAPEGRHKSCWLPQVCFQTWYTTGLQLEVAGLFLTPRNRALHELTRGSTCTWPAGIFNSKIHTWICTDNFPRWYVWLGVTVDLYIKHKTTKQRPTVICVQESGSCIAQVRVLGVYISETNIAEKKADGVEWNWE